jgi:hypothetical protein
MAHPDLSSLATALLHAPAWARIGLTAPSDRLREQAAAELAESILDSLTHPMPVNDPRQMALPL